MIFLAATFTGCFGGVETTSKKYKKELLEKVYVKNDKKQKLNILVGSEMCIRDRMKGMKKLKKN
mgnify:CR=1 FL=1